jgi:DNA-binding SARP family transcriptional activator
MPASQPVALPKPPSLDLHSRAQWRVGGGPAHPLERKHAALLAYLWLQGPTPRSRLAGLLWPDVSEDRARGNLRQRLLKLRQEMGEAAGELVLDQAGVLTLAPAVVVNPPDPAGALLLQALEFDDCEAFARWLDGQRETTRQRRKREWLAEVREAAQNQRLDDALYAADQLLQADRESEEAFRVLMEVYYLRGDHAAALSAWDRCRDMLRQLYGVLPSAPTQQLGHTILAAAQAAQAHQTQAGAWSPTPSNNGSPALPASVLRPPLLVGRQAALQALADGWRAGHVLVLTGVAGVGKSRLLADWQALLHQELTSQLNGDGASPITGPSTSASSKPSSAAAAARPGDGVLPYASLSRLLLVALDHFAPPLSTAHAHQAARLLPRLAALLAPGPGANGQPTEPARTEHERAQALLAVARLLGDCVQRGCAAFVLDDLQFADPASLAALRFLAEPGVDSDAPGDNRTSLRTPLRFVLALRADEASPEANTLLQALAASPLVAPRCTRVDLEPLSPAGATQLLASLCVPALDAAAWAPRLWQQVGGNPAFLLESLKLLLSTRAHLASDDVPGTQAAATALQLPASIEAVIQRRLDLLSPQARHLAQLAAIAGSSYSVPLAAAALACTPLALSEPLRELELRQFFYGRQFVHDVIATVTQHSVPATVAEFMHRFIAQYLAEYTVKQSGEQAGDNNAQIACHWLACGEWRLAGLAFVKAAFAAGYQALANEQAALLDQAIAALGQPQLAGNPHAQDELFAAVQERANVFESTGHEGLRPQFIARLRALARTETQHLVVLNHHNGWLTNLAQPIEEDAIAAGIPRAQAVGQPQLAFYLARMLGMHWAMNNRAADGLALLQQRESWINTEAGPVDQASYRLTRSSIFAFGDQLQEAIAEGSLALQAAVVAQDWPNALPAMSNVGLMHYWRGEYTQARQVLEQARGIREARYGSSGSGIKIDVHLGAVLYELGQHEQARQMLQGAVQHMLTWPDNDYRRTEILLAHNHLAQMFMALGQASEAATVLAHDSRGVADRFSGRRLALRLRWQRLFGDAKSAEAAALQTELQALAGRLASPFNRTLMELELARFLPTPRALAAYERLHHTPVAQQRPGLQLHTAAMLAHLSYGAGQNTTALAWAHTARELATRCQPFDMAVQEQQALLAWAV